GLKFSSKKLRAARSSAAFTAVACSQIRCHSAAVTVLVPPSVTILVSGPTPSLGQERRNATSASPCLSSLQPTISLNETGAIATLGSLAPPRPPAQAARRPATASH